MGEDTELCRLAIQHDTDKAPRTGHAYTPYYDELFRDLRRSFRKVMEIGIDRGASLRMWRDYFPEAMIYALDCNPSALIDDVRIRSFLCDQSDPWQLENVKLWAGTNFDLILDDGSHDPSHQILTARILMPALALTGYYIIEDVLRPETVTAQLPYRCEVVPFDLVRDPYSNLIIIRGGPHELS